MSTKEPKPVEIKRETVELIANHKHAGVQRVPGNKIEVTAAEKAWLIRHNKIAGPTPTEQPAATATK
ncbi:DUF7210 family protein [Phytopseudomonas daroniae]|uniref:DUF7210 family protein n=1 Tax=Phytopseudomonas daroniae TaxID=2487519 RepID=UPI0010384BC5|nr:hypothetical protein [Pseudomonas daroniae]TBU75199.1 hypothetical protein DNK10_11115 [Pseudomonas daroniae]